MQQRTVVLVESDPDMTEMILAVIEQLAGTDVVVVEDVPGNHDLTRGLTPALVIVDEDSPANCGWGVIRELSSVGETRDVPVVILCSDGDRGRELVSGGAEAFLPKPFDVNDLMALVQFYAQVMPAEFSNRVG